MYNNLQNLNGKLISNIKDLRTNEEIRRNRSTTIPFGLHWTQSAARLSLRITRVGTHSNPSRFHTYLETKFHK
jgi:hypothetical protein